MEFTYFNNTIKLLNKELTVLDKLVLDFISRVDIKYVIISGYVAILFGRSRNTEDVDIFIEDRGLGDFTNFYAKIISNKRYYSINAEDAKDAYELMRDFGSLRFAEKDTFNPNFEIKFARDETDFYSLNNPLTVDLGFEPKLKVSPLELEIPYKLYLGSEKDFADAAHLYTVFKEILDVRRLKVFLNDLNISKSVKKRVLGDIYE
jgi:hypothetical protein